MKESRLVRFAAIALILCMTAVYAAPAAQASSWNMEYFYKAYPDSHFKLTNEPDRAMTIEEFIAIVYAYSYYGGGSANTPAADKNGRQPSAWCAKYVQAEVDKNTVTPSEISWTAPATIAFAAQFLARAKGRYSYEFNNMYTFSGTGSLSTEEKMYLNVAVDCGLISYTQNMNVYVGIKRRDALKYEIPKNTVSPRAALKAPTTHMREVNAFFVDCYYDFAKSKQQLDGLKACGDDITMVTFLCGYLNSSDVSKGNTFLGCDMNHTEALKYNKGFSRDPQLDALDYCRETHKLALLGISNAHGDGFTTDMLTRMLSSQSNINTAVSEIVSAVKAYNLDGVHMDIEVTSNDTSLRRGYADFISTLAAMLHRDGLILMTSVGAYFTDEQEEASFYDYGAIGSASDYVNLLLYDDYTDTGYPWRGTVGAISNITRIGRVMRYAAMEISPSKLQLGIATYATDFNTSAVTAKDIPYTEAMAILSRGGGIITTDNDTLGGHFSYSDASGSHAVYLETDIGINERAELINRYDFNGASVFYVGSGNNYAFRLLSQKSAPKAEILTAINAGLVGRQLRRYYTRAIKRAEFCTLVRDLILRVSGSESIDEYLAAKGISAKNGAFLDTSDSTVLAINALGIVNGYPDGTFKPEKSISRSEAAAMLSRLASVLGYHPTGTSVIFNDIVDQPAWAQSGINFVSACIDPTNGKRVMNGVGSNAFSPNGSYTVEQSVMTIVRMYNAAK